MSHSFNDDNAVAFGLILFIFILFAALMSYVVLQPVWDAADTGFDEQYQATYLTDHGMQTASDIRTLATTGTLFIFCLFAAVVMVINRAIYKGDK